MNILFISEMLPIDTVASQVVFYRHLMKLKEAGHTVHILTDSNSYGARAKDLPAGFSVHLVPNRKWYYPPYKPQGVLQSLRFRDYYTKHAQPLIKKHKIDLLIGFVYGQFLAPFAAYVKRKAGLPLITFFHDDTLELNFFRSRRSLYNNTASVLQESEKVLIASGMFAENWQQYKGKFELLYPIPADVAAKHTKPVEAGKIVFGYSGTLYNELINPLTKVAAFLTDEGHSLKVVSDHTGAADALAAFPLVECRPLFETAAQASAYLLQTCDACLIPYPEKLEEMPWIRTCFPSKLIQYCQLGMPTIIVAPEESALGKWCIEKGWILYANRYDKELILSLTKKLGSPELAQQVRYFQEKVFNPSAIHAQFEQIIEKTTNHVPRRKTAL